jgi:hypothetical protein
MPPILACGGRAMKKGGGGEGGKLNEQEEILRENGK